jgi:hypothetical protein
MRLLVKEPHHSRAAVQMQSATMPNAEHPPLSRGNFFQLEEEEFVCMRMPGM